MALFKIQKGLKANLPNTFNEGYCYFTTDDGKFYIDTSSAAAGRILLNAGHADTATSATSATNDSNGSNIRNTYMSSLTMTNRTVTFNAPTGATLGSFTIPDSVTTATQDSAGNVISTYYEPKANLVSKGSATQGIYIDSSGVAQLMTYTLEKSVPANAVFTDTTYTLTQDASDGHIITLNVSTGSKQTITIPDNDTKNTAGATDTSNKIYLVGATAQTANPQTYSDNEVYVTSGTLTTNKVQVGGTAVTLEYNSTNKCLNFIFA